MVETLSLLLFFLPIALILLVANAAQRAREREEAADGLSIFTFILLVGLWAMVALAGLLFAFALVAMPTASLEEGVGLVFDPSQMSSPGLLATSLLIPALLGVLVLLRPVRRALASLLPIDPNSIVHAAALSLAMLVPLSMGLTLGVGLDTLLTTAEAVPMGAVWGQALIFVLAAMIGVGWPIRRSFGATLTRLGVEAPTVTQVLLGLGTAAAMVAVVMVLTGIAQALGLGVDADVENLTEELLGGLTGSPWGIVTLGLAAALGEEIVMRGAAQPRFGLILTSLLFALLHSNYGISLSTLIVFLLGLVLGWLRLRYNTTTAMIMHATYNGILGVLAYLSIDILERLGQ